MNRRDFLQKTAATATFIGLGGIPTGFKPAGSHLTVLHTNDVHSYVDPFPSDHPKNPNKGGVARRAALIEKIRSENPNTLLLDAGDIFQGTPYFNYYGGALELKLMSMMKYDLATMGNHDFDNGIDGFHAQLHNAEFDFVSANYDFRNTVLDGIVKPYKTFVREGIKIGIFGLGVELEGLVSKKLYKETKYLDPVEITKHIVRRLKSEEKCDLVICLSHLGYEYRNAPTKISDMRLAAQTTGIDLIIGGHTHTFLERPTIVRNAEDQEILINQTGCYGINLGRIDFYFEKGKKSSYTGRTIVV